MLPAVLPHLTAMVASEVHENNEDPLGCKDPIPMAWRSSGACLDEDPDIFFPIGSTGPAFDQIDEAKVICHQCEVSEICLKWAIEAGQDVGVWGGLSADERRALKRRTARARSTA